MILAQMSQVMESLHHGSWFWNCGSSHEFGFTARVWRLATPEEIKAMPKDAEKLYFCVTGIGNTLEAAVEDLKKQIQERNLQ
jgi:hypothetical protein